MTTKSDVKASPAKAKKDSSDSPAKSQKKALAAREARRVVKK